MLTTRTPRHPRSLAVITPLLAALLAACGGGDGAAAVPTGPMGQVTALASGLIQPGTYSVTGCVAQGSTECERRVLYYFQPNNSAGAITTQTAEPGSTPVAWANWLTTAATSAPSYSEEQFTSNLDTPATSGTPTNPRVAAYLGHPTLRDQQNGSAPGTLTNVGFGITRNTSGSGPAVGLDLLN